MASNDDALSSLPKLSLITNPSSEVTLVEKKRIEDIDIPAVPNAWVYELLGDGPRSRKGHTRSSASRLVAGNIDETVFIVSCAGYGDVWPWNDVASLATLQANKIRRVKTDLATLSE